MSTEYFLLSAEEACFNNILEIPGDLVFLPSYLEHGTSLKVRQWFSVRHSSWETGFFSHTHSVLGFFLLWLNKNSLNNAGGIGGPSLPSQLLLQHIKGTFVFSDSLIWF